MQKFDKLILFVDLRNEAQVLVMAGIPGHSTPDPCFNHPALTCCVSYLKIISLIKSASLNSRTFRNFFVHGVDSTPHTQSITSWCTWCFHKFFSALRDPLHNVWGWISELHTWIVHNHSKFPEG